jgi:hypothetical protein
MVSIYTLGHMYVEVIRLESRLKLMNFFYFQDIFKQHLQELYL